MLMKTIVTTFISAIVLCSIVIADQSASTLPESKPAVKYSTAPSSQPAVSQASLEKKFAEMMSNAKMSGSFTMNGKDKIGHDEYKLGEVKKLDGDNWQITANIKYGEHDLAFPLVVPVKWAGDAPVISVTDFGFTGLGKYTARVLFYGDEYVGIWSSSDGSHGGKMWGKVEKVK